MTKELEALDKLLSFAFVMSENMVGLTKGNYDEATFIKKTYEYLHKYNVDSKSKLELEKALKRLEAIDNINPSEALEWLDKFKGIEISALPFKDDCGTQEVDLNEVRFVGSQLNNDFHKFVNTLENYILKAQEYKEFVDVILKHMTNNGWSNDFTIEFWNMNEKELKVVNKMFKKRGK